MTPEVMLDRLLASVLPDTDRRKAAIHALLDGALSVRVLWGWGPRGYERGGYQEAEARKEGGAVGAPVSCFLAIRTRRVPESEVPYPGVDLGQACPLLHHLLADAVPDEAQRDAVIGAVDVNGVLWASMDSGPDGGMPYGVASRFAAGRQLGRCVEVKTRRFHDDD
jgi:hypothetical protein